MAHQIIRAARADEELIEIWLWIARDGPAAGRYLVVYRVEEAAVRILRVPHGRRRIGRTDVASESDDP